MTGVSDMEVRPVTLLEGVSPDFAERPHRRQLERAVRVDAQRYQRGPSVGVIVNGKPEVSVPAATMTT